MLCFQAGCNYNSGTVEDERKDPYYLKGKDQLVRRDYNGAEESFLKALERNPRNGAAHLELGVLYEEGRQDYVGAIYYYQKYLRLMGSKGEDPVIRGRITACKRAFVLQSGITPDSSSMERQLEQAVANNQNLQISLKNLNASHEALKVENAELRSRLVEQDAELARAQSLLSESANIKRVSTQVVAPGLLQSAQTQPFIAREGSTQKVGVYVIQAGDNFERVARKMNTKTKVISDLNPGVDSRKLQIGQEIKVPVQ
jgi:LysM repeat protein